ncbi:hypothetical protein Desor_2754 [Desulfosporosinus orientis DSM 765]|uniref:Stage III sporulation protein AH n=2 Tax=Desulfosporosinus orientis TaxID=1563 RepID=G7WBG5_DESOD|nr:hypothetical protein Desor_2754 [Desulfosporosinus orientis DSM 765]
MRVLLNEPIGEDYRSLIQFAFDVCDTFLFIKHSQRSYNQSFDKVVRELESDFIYCKEQNQWPGTISVPTAMVYYFHTSEKSKGIIKNITDSLFNWNAPNLPDDLCFLKGDKQWLVNTSHERLCDIITESESELEQLKTINGLIYRIVKK